MQYIKRVFAELYPEENRVIAGVAAARTFGQTIRSAVIITGVGGGTAGTIAITRDDLASFVLPVFLVGVGLMLLNAAIAAVVAWDDVARNGLTEKYAEAVEEQRVGKYGDYGQAPETLSEGDND